MSKRTRNPATTSTNSRGSSSSSRARTLQTAVVVGLTAAFSFYGGLLVGTTSTTATSVLSAGGASSSSSTEKEKEIQARVLAEVRRINSITSAQKVNNDDTASRFPVGVRDFMVGLSVVDRDAFAAAFNLGVPLDESGVQNQEVMILYQSRAALPNDAFAATEAVSQTAIPAISSVDEAVANCDYLNLILTDHTPKERRQCTALMGQYEAFHIQKYMRLPVEKPTVADESDIDPISSITSGNAYSKKMDHTLPLRFVNRGAQSNGRKSTNPPSQEQTMAYWNVLQKYLGNFERMLEELKLILERVADRETNTVIVLVCNFGQSELLLNFVCAAKTRGLDLSHILVFATDVETRDLIAGISSGDGDDIAVFYDATNYGDMPKKAAGRYADKTFMSMMMAKVFCVHTTAWLGYNVLFQDVDVIWYKNPLPYFHDTTAVDKDFDIYFQDE